jgi:4-hydroxy-tetrahydrodipicolinate synthase
LRLGAKAALIGMGAVCCDLQAELIEAHFTGKAERFLELSDLIDRLAEVLFINPMEGYIGRILWALSKLGVIPRDATNDPAGPSLTSREVDNIADALNTLNVQVG